MLILQPFLMPVCPAANPPFCPTWACRQLQTTACRLTSYSRLLEKSKRFTYWKTLWKTSISAGWQPRVQTPRHRQPRWRTSWSRPSKRWRRPWWKGWSCQWWTRPLTTTRCASSWVLTLGMSMDGVQVLPLVLHFDGGCSHGTIT